VFDVRKEKKRKEDAGGRDLWNSDVRELAHMGGNDDF